MSNEAYKNIPIKSLIFSYGIRKGKIISEFSLSFLDKVINTFYKNKLPIGLTSKDYGKVLLHVNNIYVLY